MYKYYIIASVIVGIVGMAITYLVTIISDKNDTIKRLQSDLIVSQAEMLVVNRQLQAQSDKFKTFNRQQEAYKNKLIDKYASFPLENKDCNTNVLDAMLRKSFE